MSAKRLRKIREWASSADLSVFLPLIFVSMSFFLTMANVPLKYVFPPIALAIGVLTFLGGCKNHLREGYIFATYVTVLGMHWFMRFCGYPLPKLVWFVNTALLCLGIILLLQKNGIQPFKSFASLRFPLFVSLAYSIFFLYVVMDAPVEIIMIACFKIALLFCALPLLNAQPSPLNIGVITSVFFIELSSVGFIVFPLEHADMKDFLGVNAFAPLMVASCAFFPYATLQKKIDRRFPMVVLATAMVTFVAAMIDRAFWSGLHTFTYNIIISFFFFFFIVICLFVFKIAERIVMESKETLFRFGHAMNEIATNSEDHHTQIEWTYRVTKQFSDNISGFELLLGNKNAIMVGERDKYIRAMKHREDVLTGNAFFSSYPSQSYEIIEPTLVLHLERLRREIMATRLAHHDPLTGLLNRNGIYATLSRMSYRDPKHPIAVMILDIDYFKVINDTFGHPFGDKCLISLADALVSSVRPNDAVGRWGGEEMIVVFDGLSDAEEVQDVVARVFFLTSGTIKLSENSVLTYSAGYAFGCACDFHTLVEKADKGLYLAKHNGRNCFINAMESVDVENLEAKKVGHYAGI